jgi:hypothetical protein
MNNQHIVEPPMAAQLAVRPIGGRVNKRMLWIRRCLAVGHLALGLVLLLGLVSYPVLGLRDLPQLLTAARSIRLPGTFLLIAAVVLLCEMALGAWILVLAHWLWSGHRRLRTALLATHGFLLLLGSLAIKWGFDTIDAAERSTAHGGGLFSPLSFFPVLIGAPLLVFALCSLAVALWAVPRQQPEYR